MNMESFAKIYKRCQSYKPEKDLSTPHEALTTVGVDFEGRQVSTSKYVIDDPRHRNDGLKPSDFALENQILVGVEQRPVYCSHQSAYITSEIERVNKMNVEQFNSAQNESTTE